MVLRQRVSYLMDLKRNSYFIELLIKLRESVYVKFYTNKLVIFTFIIKSKRSICFYVDPVEIGGVCSSTDCFTADLGSARNNNTALHILQNYNIL